MPEIRQSILIMDNNLKQLSTHYDTKTSNQLNVLNEQVNTIEKRWTQLLSSLEQCSSRVNINSFVFFLFILYKNSLNILVKKFFFNF